MRLRSLLPDDSADLTAPRLTAPDIDVSDWEDNESPTLNDSALSLDPSEISRSLAMLAEPDEGDTGGFVLGTEYALRVFNADGDETWNQPTIGPVWAVNASTDGRWVVAAIGDGTSRWYRVGDGVEQLAFYPHPDRKRWVLWTPSGYYDASPGAEDVIGWHVNDGPDRAAQFFPASLFRSRFYRPDLVSAVLDSADEEAAMLSTAAEEGELPPDSDLAAILPPVVQLLSPADGERFARARVTVRYRVQTAADAPVDDVKVLVDGRPLEEARGLRPVAAASAAPAADGQEFALEITLPTRDLTLSLIAENRHGKSEASSLHLQ